MTSLPFPAAPTFAPDQEPRDWLPSPDALVDACADAISSGEPPGFLSLANELAAPTLDLTVTPLTARATLLGAAEGRAFYHHELRRRIPMPDALLPEIAVWEAGTTPVWADGVLAEPKYFSFFQDGPFPAYNPNHRRKWRAHELLHGASRWFWHPQMTRFEFYVSAHLNELLPVIHWYHLDEIFRPRCPDHQDQVLHREHCLPCQSAARHYWNCQDLLTPERRTAALQHVEHAWDHFQEEWDASTRELHTGRTHPTPRPRLDASSDALGYLRAHWNRVTAWSFGHWVETFLTDGVDYFSSLWDLRHNIGHTLHRLVGSDISLDPAEYLARRARCQLQDIGYRALLALEWMDPDSPEGRRAEDTLLPFLTEGGRLCSSLLQDPTLTDQALSHCALICERFSALASTFPDDVADAFLGLGYRFIDPSVFITAGAGQLLSGLEDALPTTMDALPNPLPHILAFGESPHFDDPSRLSQRFAQWLATTDPSPTLTDTARFEAWLNAEPRTDPEATHFASLPEHPSDVKNLSGRLRPHRTLRRATFPPKLLTELTGQPFPGSDPVRLAAVLIDGTPRLLPEDEPTTTLLDHILANTPPQEWWDFSLAASLTQLLELGHILWLPTPPSP